MVKERLFQLLLVLSILGVNLSWGGDDAMKFQLEGTKISYHSFAERKKAFVDYKMLKGLASQVDSFVEELPSPEDREAFLSKFLGYCGVAFDAVDADGRSGFKNISEVKQYLEEAGKKSDGSYKEFGVKNKEAAAYFASLLNLGAEVFFKKQDRVNASKVKDEGPFGGLIQEHVLDVRGLVAPPH